MRGNESESGKWHDRFGERYGFSAYEKEVLRLYMLFGLEDEEIRTVMQLSERELKMHIDCMTGKTRSNTMRELQALFLRYLLQKLPS